jgi:hypothetical protein
MRDEIDELSRFLAPDSGDDSDADLGSELDPFPRIGYRQLVGDLARPEVVGVSTVNVFFWFEQLDEIGPAFNWRKSSPFELFSLVGVLELVLEEIVAVIRAQVDVDLEEQTVILDLAGP